MNEQVADSPEGGRQGLRPVGSSTGSPCQEGFGAGSYQGALCVWGDVEPMHSSEPVLAGAARLL